MEMKKTLDGFPDTHFFICSQTFIDNFAGSVGGNQLTKIKGHHCQQVEQMDTHMHTHTHTHTHTHLHTHTMAETQRSYFVILYSFE